MAKKRRSAKQKAATRKLVALNKSKRSSRKSTTKRRKTSKRRNVTRVIRKVVRRRTMAKRRRSVSRKRGFKIPFISNPLFKKAAAGVGAGVLLTTVLGLIGQQQLAQNPVVKVGAGFATGDIVGAASALLLGGGLNLGGNGGGSTMSQAGAA